MSNIKVIGHINPDSDSTCSPIVYAWYLTNKKNIQAEAVLANEINKETKYILERFKTTKPQIINALSESDKIIIIDTNNPDELIEGYDKAEIIEIIDHHKLFGTLTTNSPIKVTMRSYACIATIMWEMFKSEFNILDIPINIAGLMSSAIISDTLNLTSPTTTDLDKIALSELSKIANINIDELASQMFEAKSDLTNMTPRDILKVDSKIFDLKGKKILISVLETTKPENALNQYNQIKNEMINLKKEENLDGILFYIIDIINTSSQVIVTNEFERELIEKAHGVHFVGATQDLPGIVSRKKQIVPNLENAL